MIKTAKFKIMGMHCNSCAMNIDGELEDTNGISSANTSYAKSQTEVKFNSDKISLEKIGKIIEKVGYQTEIIE